MKPPRSVWVRRLMTGVYQVALHEPPFGEWTRYVLPAKPKPRKRKGAR